MREDCIAYEYKSININKDLEPMYTDCYKNFGWIICNNEKRDYYINNNYDSNIVELKFKRNRNISNRTELNKLQRICEDAFITIDKLEKMPNQFATMYSLIVGFIALIFIAISVLTIIKNIWFLAILCGLIGFVICAFPYSIYKNTLESKEKENKIKIDEQQDIIYNAYEEAKKIVLESE